MVMKLYSHELSVSAQRVILILIEKRVPFEIIDVDIIKGEHKEAAYKEMQPWGLLPVLDDDGFRVYESRAICRYIAEKYADQGTQLIPTGLKERALCEQGVAIEAGTTDPCVFAALNEKMFKEFKLGVPCDDEIYAVFMKRVEKVLEVYEGILSKQKYVGGNELTVADLYHLPTGFALQTQCGEDVFLSGKRPHVARWWRELIERDSWKQVAELNKPGLHMLDPENEQPKVNGDALN